MADPSKRFWQSFLRAVETEPRHAHEIRGASGIIHPLLAVGVDEARARTVLVSADADARTAALAQADIQASLPSMKVVMARPVAINLRAFASSLISQLGGSRVPMNILQRFSSEGDEGQKQMQQFFAETFSGNVIAVTRPFKYVELNVPSFWKELIQQLSLLQFEGLPQPDSNELKQELKGTPTLVLERLMGFDPIAADRAGGVCAIPLFDLLETDFEVFENGATDSAREVLRVHNVLHYFFPAADQIILAAAERSAPTPPSLAMRQVAFAPEAGHPLAPNEIVDPRTDLIDLLEALRAKGLVTEGNTVLELTPAGHSVRAEVKFKPREGLMEKLARVLSIKIDMSLKDIFK
jgi:hypothetical protein